MTPAGGAGGSPKNERPLSKLDWFLLPTICLLTAGVLVVSAEGLSRHLYAESQSSTLPCLIVDDPTTGVRAIPKTECFQKLRESASTQYTFNSCGHRAGMECGPKPADTYRIVLIGSSFNYGMGVASQESFATLLPGQLSRRTGRKIELYNEAMQWGFPRSVDLRFGEVLAAKPDLILWPLTPMDFDGVNVTLPYLGAPKSRDAVAGEDGQPTDAPATRWGRLKKALREKSPSELVARAWSVVTSPLKDSSSVFLLQHMLFKSQSMYVKQYLMQGDSTEYLRTNPGPAWREKLAAFAKYYADVQARANKIGATVVVAVMPERAQAALISMNEWPDGVDPYALGRDVRAIVTRQGGTYVDILSDFRQVPNPERMYLPVDGHPDVGGHATLSRMLAEALSDGAVPALSNNLQRVAE